MKASTELSEVLKQACEEVESWHDWQHSNAMQKSANTNDEERERCIPLRNTRIELK